MQWLRSPLPNRLQDVGARELAALSEVRKHQYRANLGRRPGAELGVQMKKHFDWFLVLALGVVLVLMLMLLGCATIRGIKGYEKNGTTTYGTPLGERGYLRPDNTRAWSIPCRPNATERAYEILLEGRGNPGAALYYFRCRGPNEYKEMLKEIKNRRWWLEPDVKHHPERKQ